MKEINYNGRRALQIENDQLRVTTTLEGAHVAEILHKPTGVSPLWTPPWRSIEPTSYDPAKHPEYGASNESQLLSGILGHNLCLDIFGAPGDEEAAAGIPVHGEAPVIPYNASAIANQVSLSATLNLAQLRFTRHLRIAPGSMVVRFSEELDNLAATDRPIAWTQHVTLGPPFLVPGQTQFRIPATRSKVIDVDFNDGLGPQKPGAEFAWPLCPRKDGGVFDFSTYTADPVSGGFTSHLMDPSREHAYFLAWSPSSKLLFGYVWMRADFPWLARWEENHLRTQPPWNGKGLTCGMEFGVSPVVEARQAMVNRGSLFGVPSFRWAAAKTTLRAEYCAFVALRDAIPESVEWDGEFGVRFQS
jgi:hypothetical protein